MKLRRANNTANWREYARMLCYYVELAVHSLDSAISRASHFSERTVKPGRTSPSSSEIDAPPPVDTWLSLSSAL